MSVEERVITWLAQQDIEIYLVGDTATGQALVIDAPYEATRPVLDEAAQRGWTIDQIVITHTHWDHVADALALTEETGAPLLRIRSR